MQLLVSKRYFIRNQHLMLFQLVLLISLESLLSSHDIKSDFKALFPSFISRVAVNFMINFFLVRSSIPFHRPKYCSNGLLFKVRGLPCFLLQFTELIGRWSNVSKIKLTIKTKTNVISDGDFICWPDPISRLGPLGNPDINRNAPLAQTIE